MTDKEFKALPHGAESEEFALLKKGGKITNGYFPDVIIKKCNEQRYIILEFENSSSRKHILGGFVKAAKFLSNDDRQGILIFVLGNKDAEAIKNHLQEYFNWLCGITNLQEVWVIPINEYISVMREIGSEKFRMKGRHLEPSKK